MIHLSSNDLKSLRGLVRGQLKARQKKLDRFAPHEGQSPTEAELGRQKIITSLAFYAGLHDRVREAELTAALAALGEG